MRITFAVALVAVLSSPVLAQESSQIEVESNLEAAVSTIDTVSNVSEGEVSAAWGTDSPEFNSVEPVLYQEGIVVEGAADAVEAAGEVAADAIVGTVEGDAVSEPTSVVSGEVIQSAPIYSESAPIEGGTVISEGETVVSSSPMVGAPVAAASSCGCGSTGAAPVTYSSAPVAAAEAPVVSYSSAPVQYSAPVSNPCCNQPRRGFFRTLFGN